LLWILNGRTDLKYLEDNGVNYWRPDYERSLTGISNAVAVVADLSNEALHKTITISIE
jgi:thymidylate synthase